MPDPSKPAERSEEADQAYIREHYTKYEHLVPMRDGTRLYTAVYAPKDDVETYPILLTRTPYGARPYGPDNYPERPPGPMRHYAKERFIFARQDVRGRNASEGVFEHVRPRSEDAGGIDETTDTCDTIDWLLQHTPGHNGKVGMTGISYEGSYTVMGMMAAHPALACASPQAPMVDWFLGDDFHHNGVFYLASGFGFLAHFEQALERPTRERPIPFDFETPDGYEFFLELGALKNIDDKYFHGERPFWQQLVDHGSYDEFWQARDLLRHLQDVTPAVMTVGGWFDAEDLYGPLGVHRTVRDESPGTQQVLVMGPWAHGGWHRGDGERLGDVQFHQRSAQHFRRQVELPWLNHHLKGADDPKLAGAIVFETGTNQWRHYDAWPPSVTTQRSLYVRGNGSLSFDPPVETGDGYDEYVSDPANPVPHIAAIATGMTAEHMLADQRFAARRPDVLVYRTPPLEEDLTVAGPLVADLRVSTTGTDSDWVVKLIDVFHGDYPNPEPNPASIRMGGYQQLIRGEAFRGKFRNSFTEPEPFVPGEITRIWYRLPDIYHTFRRGHRIMVQIQSSWFPLVDRNPQTFCDIYRCDDAAFQKATQRVYFTAAEPSHIELPVLSRQVLDG